MSDNLRQQLEISVPQPTEAELCIKFNTIVEDFKICLHEKSRSCSNFESEKVVDRLKKSCTVSGCELLTEDECNSIDTTDKLFNKLKEKGHLNLNFSSCGILRGLIDAVKRYSDTIEIDEFT